MYDNNYCYGNRKARLCNSKTGSITGAQFDVLEIKDGVQLYRNPVQTMDKIKSLIQGLKQDDALDSFWAGSISDSKIGTIPVYIPNLEDMPLQ